MAAGLEPITRTDADATDLILIYAAEYADFAAAYAAAANKTLVISSSMTVAANTSIPATTRVKFENAGILSVNSGVTLTFLSGNVDALPSTQIFAATGTNSGGAGTGSVRFTQAYPLAFSPMWFGALGNGSADDTHAFKSCVAAIAAPDANPSYRKGGVIEIPVPPSYYKLTDTIEVYSPSEIRGSQGIGHGNLGAPELNWSVACNGFVFHRYNTSATYSNSNADGAKLKGLLLRGTYPSSTGTANISGLTVTKVTGPDYDDDFASYYTMLINDSIYVVETGGSATSLTVHKPRLIVHVTNGSPTVDNGIGYVNGYAWPSGTDWDGQTIKIKGVNYTIASHTALQITLTTNYTGPTQTSVAAQVLGLNTLTGVTTTLHKYHGVNAWCNIAIENVTCVGWGGNGLNLDTSTVPSAMPGAIDINCNNSFISKISCSANRGSGILTKGLNSNNILITNFDGTANSGCGFMEASFLGNVWVAPHTSFNVFGSNFSNQAIGVYSIFGMYSEGGQPSSVGSQYGIAVGGDWGAGWASTWEGYLMGSQMVGAYSGYMGVSPIQLLNVQGSYDGAQPTTTIAAYIGNKVNAYHTFLGFGTGDDTASNSGGFSPDIPGFAYTFGYPNTGALGNGWYTWAYDDPAGFDATKHVLAMSGSQASVGAKKIWFPNGIHFIGSAKDIGLLRTGTNQLTVDDGAGSPAKLVVSALNASVSLTTPKVIWTGGVQDLYGTGSPEGVVTAAVGSTYRRVDGGAATSLYVKESGSGNTGWVAYGSVTIPAALCARVYHSTNQSIANTTVTALAFDTERDDTDVIHDTSTNNTRLTCKTAGFYQVGGHVEFASGGGAVRSTNIRLNGSTVISASNTIPISGLSTQVAISTQYRLAVNDYLELLVYQDSGGALDVVSSGNYSPEFMMTRLGA